MAALVALAAGWLFLRASLPKIDGEVAAPGLASPVEILRDRDGVPHILAMNDHDGWFAMGYAHAQDRLWEMEFQRRVAQGRVSELLGERSYDLDRLMRTLGLARLADRIVAKMDAPTRANLDAYSAGVNAFIGSKPVLPVEFQVFRVKPEPWKPADTMGWLLVMSWDLSSNWRNELARLRFASALGRERAQEFMPPYPGDPPYALPDFKSLYAELAPAANAMLAALPTHEEAVGSNNWVVDATMTTTGKPLLANDPHLGVQAPSLWYLVHMSTPNGNVVGGTLPGVPFVVLGRNDDVAWSMTTTTSDTQDLFVEKVVEGDPTSYVTPTGNAKFETREEVIRVKDEERRITIRSTRHGPVLSDVVKGASELLPRDRVFALAWSALTEDFNVARAGFALDRAKNAKEVVAALRDFTAPHQNVVYADREGHIGFIAPARVPVRRADNEAMGRVPVPGWDEKYDWQGFIPYEKLPQYQDPPTHHIVTANHKITPPGYPEFISVDWFPPYRADRIEEMLAAQPKHSIESFQRMQADVQSQLARQMLPFARDAKPETSARPRGPGHAHRVERRHDARCAGAARLLGVVPRAHAAGLRRRAGPDLPRCLGAAPALHALGDEGRERHGPLVRRREDARYRDLRAADGAGVRPRRGRPRQALRQARGLALGPRTTPRETIAPSASCRSSTASSTSIPRRRAIPTPWTWATTSSATTRGPSPTAMRPACARSTISPTLTARSTCSRPGNRGM